MLSKTTLSELINFVDELDAERSQLIEEALTHSFEILDIKLASKRLKELE